jgi:hypothetical protein
VTGLLKTHKISKPILIHGLAIIVTLVAIKVLLDVSQNALLLYMPPIGFAVFLLLMFGIQPLIVGVLNIIMIHRIYNCEGWQIGFWLNGIFLLLFFSTINLLIQTTVGLTFFWGLGIVEVFLLSYPFGYLGKFSNRGCETKSTLQIKE